MKTKVLILLITTLALDAYADSATWKLNAGSGSWNATSSWTPATIPNGPDDVATFDASNTLIPSVLADTEVNSVVFNASASVFTITAMPGFTLTISGEGITNNSGKNETFVTAVDSFSGESGAIVFTGTATAGLQTVFNFDNLNFFASSTAGGATLLTAGFFSSYQTAFHDSSTAGNATISNFGFLNFVDSSTAGSANITNEPTFSGLAGFTQFFDESTAGNALITTPGSSSISGDGGGAVFSDSSSAADATLVATGGVSEFGGGLIAFIDTATAGNATIIVSGNLTDGQEGKVFFEASSTGGTARVELFDRGTMLCTSRNGVPVTIGSLEGDGFVTLSDNELLVGNNNLSTAFSGIIDDPGAVGSLKKIGQGTLTLRNANTYTGGTKVSSGRLLVNNTGGSGTGTGPLQVSGGRFGGTGIVSGAVTIGMGGKHAAALLPGDHGTGILTIQNRLAFGSNGSDHWTFDTRTLQADGVVAQGVTINPGATFTITGRGGGQLPLGTVFTVIDNTALTPIAGTFANLPDGSTVTSGANNFQVNYKGGDGNDLTLTVAP